MPAITFPLDQERHVYLEDGTRALIPRGTPMTVQPTIFFPTVRSSGERGIFIPAGDGSSRLDRAAYGHDCTSDDERIKLDHFIHDSSAGPLVFSSVMTPEVCWDLLFRTRGWDGIPGWSDSSEDLFIEDTAFYQDGREYRPLIINAIGQLMYQTVVVREKHLSIGMRIEASFQNGNRGQEPSMIVEIRDLPVELAYGQVYLPEYTAVFFRCSVWELFLRHHSDGWSEGENGELLLTSSPDVPATTPVFLKRAAPGDAEAC